MITSVSNAKVKLVRSLSRRRARYAAQQFVVEGVRSIQEALRAGIIPALAFCTQEAAREPRVSDLLDALRPHLPAQDLIEVSDAVMQAMSNTESPPGLLAVVPFIQLPLPSRARFILIVDAVRDPGNVGTILRSAWAGGVELALFAPSTADPYNEKVVRGAMGAHFHLPLRVMSNWQQVASAVEGIPRIYLADAQGQVVYRDADWSRPIALIVGGEAEGASEQARQLATARVRIPMQSGAESLNAAMAATVLVFHAAQT